MSEILQARSALGTLPHDAPRTHGNTRVVHLAERPIDRAFTLRFDEFEARAVASVNALTGLSLDGRNRGVSTNCGSAVWLGPGDWLVMPAAGSAGMPSARSGEPSATALEAISQLSSIATAPPSAVVEPGPLWTAIESSDLWFALRLDGPHNCDVLMKGCGMGLDPSRFPRGAAAVTRLARIRALIHHVEPSPAYDIYVERSYAAYLWAWLVDAMNEFLHPLER